MATEQWGVAERVCERILLKKNIANKPILKCALISKEFFP